MTSRWPLGAALALLVGGAPACAPKQTIPIECVPQTVTVYVDGEELDDIPEEVQLRADRHHVLLFKGEGYKPEMIVLETTEVDGESRLTPGSLCVEPVYVGAGRQVEVEIEIDEEEEEKP